MRETQCALRNCRQLSQIRCYEAWSLAWADIYKTHQNSHLFCICPLTSSTLTSSTDSTRPVIWKRRKPKPSLLSPLLLNKLSPLALASRWVRTSSIVCQFSVAFLSRNTADTLNPTTESVSSQQKHKAKRIRGGLVGPVTLSLRSPSFPLSHFRVGLFFFYSPFDTVSRRLPKKHLLIVYHQDLLQLFDCFCCW